jgi:toxin ParE1/3/4
VAHEVVFSPEARDDLLQLYDYIAARSGPARARSFTERIFSYCLGFGTFPQRGTRRDDLRPGLRVVGFARRVTIAFHIADDTVTIDRVLYGTGSEQGSSQRVTRGKPAGLKRQS